MKKSLIILGIIVLLAALSFSGLRYAHAKGANLVLRNNSKEAIHDLQVMGGDQEFPLGSLQPNEQKEVKVVGYSDSHWNIRGTWPDGVSFNKSFGYITHSANYSDQVQIDGRETFTYEHCLWFLFPPF